MTGSRLSVVMPCYNYGRYLTEAVTSVLRQKGALPALEIVIVNDASSDPYTLDKLSDVSKLDPRVRVIHHEQRRGAATARNSGIDSAHGDWIAFLDSDDVWTRGSLRFRWELIQGTPDIHWLGADFVRLHEDGTTDETGFFHTRKLPNSLLDWNAEAGKVVRLARPVATFLRASMGWTSTIMVRRELIRRVGGFEPSLGNYEDHHLWLRLARITDFFFLPEVVVLYRQHPLSVSRQDVPPAYWYIKALRALSNDPSFRQYRGLIRSKLASLYGRDAYYHRKRAETSLAVAAAAQALWCRPNRISAWRNLLGAILRIP